MAIVLAIGATTWAFSQNQNGQLWLGLEVSGSINDRWSYFVNPEYYTLYTGGPRWYEAALISGVSYYASPSFTFSGGLYNSYILQDEEDRTFELRPRLGATWNITRATNRIYCKLQTEYEWRLFWNLNRSNFSRSNRIRIRPDVLISVLKENTVQDKNICLRVYGEYFQNLDKNIRERFWNRYGTAIGVYYRSSPKWRYELRYLLQGSKNTKEAERPDAISHIVYLLVTYVIP